MKQELPRKPFEFVMLTYSVMSAIAGIITLTVLNRREYLRLRADRQDLLDACIGVLTSGEIQHGGDHFPRLVGTHAGRHFRAELIPDTMTIRRLPQLWLSMTIMDARPGIAEFGILVRPSGSEFYSLTNTFDRRLDVPASLPEEVLIRGNSAQAQFLVNALADDLASILVDGKIKEIAVTRKGLRMVWQAGEGRRGEHLLLRQCVFDDARLEPETLASLISQLDNLGQAITKTTTASAA